MKIVKQKEETRMETTGNVEDRLVDCNLAAILNPP